jgi:beta-lactam-binding protein with PASTA domain
VVVALVLAIAVGFFLARPGDATVPAPSLVGLTRDEAVTRASDAGVLLEFEERASDDAKDVVIGQTPGAGEWLRDGGTVTVFVSRGPPPVPVPDVTGLPQAEAELVLADEEFALEVVTEYDETVAEGLVLRTDPPANAELSVGSPIRVFVSAGPAPVPVPDVVGATYDEAVATLADSSFGATRVDEFSDTVESGDVIRTEPAVGTEIDRDSTVTVVVSKGPEPVTVPSLIGTDVEAAAAQLEALGLEADVSNFRPGRVVRLQDPPAGTQLQKGEEVTLLL